MSIKFIKPTLLSILLLVLMSSCDLYNSYFGRTEVFLGQVITPEEATDEGTVLWAFSNLPESSSLTGFTPTDSSNMVSFRPDVVGEYNVSVSIENGDDVKELAYFYTVIENPDGALNTAVAETNTQEVEATNPAVRDYYKKKGIDRAYMNKLVTKDDDIPVVKPTPKKKKHTVTKKRTVVKKPSTKKKKSKSSRKKTAKKSNGLYTIQVASYPEMESAQLTSKKLLDDFGVESYIQRIFIAEKDKVFYRVRVGRFSNFKKANAYASQLRKRTRIPVWVDNLRQEL